jgi:hypothetical protein
MKDNKHLSQILTECALACQICANDCLRVNNSESLMRCIQLSLDCADVCHLTIKLLLRNSEILDDQLDVCAEICALCAEECNRHYSKISQCRQCAELCILAEEACYLHV